MTLLSDRQQTAERLTRELQALGATVTNSLPLAEDRPLRFWCSDYKKREILTALADAGYEPVFAGTSFQPCTATYSMGLVNNFEIRLPRQVQPIVDDRNHSRRRRPPGPTLKRSCRHVEIPRQGLTMAKNNGKKELLDLYGFLNDLLWEDLRENAAETIARVRKENPVEYLKIVSTKVAQDLLAIAMAKKAGEPQTSDEIALALLADVGLTEPDEAAKARALEAYDTMIARLEAIRNEALGFH